MSNVSGKGCRLRCRWDLGTRTSKKWEFQQGMLHGMPRCTLIKALWNSRPEAAPPETTPEKPKARIVLFFFDDFSSPYNAILEMLDTRRRQLPRPWHLSRRLRFCRSNFEDVYKNIWIYTIWIFYMNILYEYIIWKCIYIYIMYWMVWKINLCHNAIVHKRAQAKPKEAAKASGHAL